MILDIAHFTKQEKKYWQQLEELVYKKENSSIQWTCSELQEFHALYERCATDLSRVREFITEKQLQDYLENLLVQAHSQIMASRRQSLRFRPLHWFFVEFPNAFRRHLHAFRMALLITFIGALVGAGATYFDPASKAVLLPFAHLQGNPDERVAMEEFVGESNIMEGHKSSFASQLMVNNIRVSILLLALGMTLGVGSLIGLFYNGIILGSVILDYMVAGQEAFLFGWLLPHGSIELPAVFIAGQAGLILGHTLIVRRSISTEQRKANITDLVHLIGGVAVMLIWAGIIESFFSQYHEPVLPYSIKIAFGLTQLLLLSLFLGLCGKKRIGGVQ